MKAVAPAPPRAAMWLARHLVRGAHREFLLGDLAEAYSLELARARSPREARLWFRSQVLRSVAWSLVHAPARRGSTRRIAGRRRPGDDLVVTLLANAKYALRALLRSPGFVLVAVATLAIGIGGMTTIFSFVDAVLLRALPFDEPQGLVVLGGYDRQTGAGRFTSSFPDFADFRDRNRSFAAMAGIDTGSAHLTGREVEPLRVSLAQVSHELFPLLGVEPALGRGLLAEDDRVGAEPVAVLSHGLWKSRYGSDPGVLGRRILLDGVDHVVVGVLGPGESFPESTDVWVALESHYTALEHRGVHTLKIVARLGDGVSLAQAGEDVDAIALDLRELYPGTNTDQGGRGSSPCSSRW